MDDSKLMDLLGGSGKISFMLNIKQNRAAMWRKRGIPARWRPTMWAMLETRCPDVAATLDRDAFLGVHLTGDAA